MLLNTNDMTILSCLKVSLTSRVQHKPAMDYASRDMGGSHDFNDYQPYCAGENIRHIDWDRYMRDATLLTRQYEKLERSEVSVVLDLSRSVTVSQKDRAAKYLTAALCFCLLNKGMTVKLLSDNRLERYSGHAGWQRIHRDIDILKAGNSKTLTLSPVDSTMSKYVIIVSDLIFSDGLDQFKEKVTIGNRKGFLINLSSHLDRNPDLRGNLRLHDAQDNRNISCYVDRKMIDRYLKCRSEYYHQIELYCMKMNWQYKEVGIEDDLKQQISLLAPSGTLYI